MINRCFCYIRGEYDFTVLLLLSRAIKYIPRKQQRKMSHVEYNYLLFFLVAKSFWFYPKHYISLLN